ncbi:MAG: LamG domain-containing protein [Planctomycetes bacterium]|nr:LamG domain-containing protein [Planctomycetota bacterium]
MPVGLSCLLLYVLPAVDPAAGSPYLRPEFRSLMDAVTFHMSFDAGTMRPDMAEGPKWEPTVFGSRRGEFTHPRFAPGVLGRSLVLGTGGAVYPRLGNVLLERRGAIAVWVMPENWQRPRDDNCVFVMTSNATFYLERQGPDIDDGRVRRQEGILYITRVPGARPATINGGSDWQNGRWYLLVANWSWPTMELSVNGQPFLVRSLSQSPRPGTFGNLVVGDRSGRPRGRLDELLAFRRPLKLEEVRLLWTLWPAPRRDNRAHRRRMCRDSMFSRRRPVRANPDACRSRFPLAMLDRPRLGQRWILRPPEDSHSMAPRRAYRIGCLAVCHTSGSQDSNRRTQ